MSQWKCPSRNVLGEMSYLCICICIYAYMYIRIYATHIRIYAYAYMHVCIYACMHTSLLISSSIRQCRSKRRCEGASQWQTLPLRKIVLLPSFSLYKRIIHYFHLLITTLRNIKVTPPGFQHTRNYSSPNH